MNSTYITCNINALGCFIFEFRHCTVEYISVLWREHCQVGVYLWTLERGGTMVDGRFLRGHSLNLYHPQCECLTVFRIWATLWYLRVYHVSETLTFPWLRLKPPVIWMLSITQYLSHVTVYSGISLLWDINNDKLGSLWDTPDQCGTMADGSFLRSHGLTLYHLQYECLGLLSIWISPFILGYIVILRRE